ncbi:unnamed protein product, partial [Lymnaea stagnalis]
MNKFKAVSFGIPAAIVIICESINWIELGNYFGGPLWILGLGFIVCGVLAFITAILQNTTLYMVCGIISGLMVTITGIIIGSSLVAHPVLTNVFSLYPQACNDTNTNCQCKDVNNRQYVEVPFASCSSVTNVHHYLVVAAVATTFCLVFLLVEVILSCYFAHKGQVPSRGVVFPSEREDWRPYNTKVVKSHRGSYEDPITISASVLAVPISSTSLTNTPDTHESV